MTNIDILDFLMYFPCALLLWLILNVIYGEHWTDGIGAIAGLIIEMLFTTLYIIAFGICDYNWIDILKGTQHIFTNIQLNW